MHVPMSVQSGPILWLILLFATSSRAQQASLPTSESALIDSAFCSVQEAILEQAGFPDASCVLKDGQLQVKYTRSRFRQGFVSNRKLLELLTPALLAGTRTIHLTVGDRSIPFYTYTIPVEQGIVQTEASGFLIGQTPLFPGQDQPLPLRGDDYTLLFSLDPQLRFSFGASPDPVQIQFNVLPRLDLRLWKGSLLRFQYILPVWNELDIPEDDVFRPGLITLSQYVRPGRGLFASATVGYFYPYRYGIQTRMGKFLLRDRAFVGMEFGLTGYASYPKRLYVDPPVAGWEVSDIQYINYLITAGWRWNRPHLQMTAAWGRGLFDQQIKSLMISRQFNLTTVELFAQQLDADWNYGVRLQIPIPFFSRLVGKRLLCQTAPFLDYTYNGTQIYLQDYQTGQRFPFLSDHLHPDLIVH